jgi:hypothetical protein
VRRVGERGEARTSCCTSTSACTRTKTCSCTSSKARQTPSASSSGNPSIAVHWTVSTGGPRDPGPRDRNALAASAACLGQPARPADRRRALTAKRFSALPPGAGSSGLDG